MHIHKRGTDLPHPSSTKMDSLLAEFLMSLMEATLREPAHKRVLILLLLVCFPPTDMCVSSPYEVNAADCSKSIQN